MACVPHDKVFHTKTPMQPWFFGTRPYRLSLRVWAGLCVHQCAPRHGKSTRATSTLPPMAELSSRLLDAWRSARDGISSLILRKDRCPIVQAKVPQHASQAGLRDRW